MLRTGTRGTVIQLAIVLPLLASIRLPMKNVASLSMRYLLLALVMLAAGVAIWASLGEERKSSYMTSFRIDKNEGVLDTRSLVWMPAMEKARERPWLGRGFGSSSFFALTDEEYRGTDSRTMAFRTTVHSQYLEIFYEFGVLGFMVFAWLLVALLQNVIRIYSYRGPQALLWRILAIYAVVGVVEGLTHGGQITTGEMNLLQRWILYCCVLAFPLGSSSLKQRFAVSRLAGRMRASRGKHVPVPQPAQLALAKVKASTRSR
jgi:O-antigen ligase